MDDEGDDKDDTKRRSRNLSEKKRRDQFNMLINELSSMVSNTSRKMDKSTVLKSTISFLKNHNDLSVRSLVHEIQEDWKPSFLSNEEFTHITLEAVDGFIIVFSARGHIMYVSGSVTSLLGHLPSDLMNGPMSIFDLVYPGDHSALSELLSSCRHGNIGKENQLGFSVHVRRGELHPEDDQHAFTYDLVHFLGYFRGEAESAFDSADNAVSSTNVFSSEPLSGLVFVGTGRLQTAHLLSEMSFACETVRSEFTSRHNLDWKFLALDARATPIIGYVQLEVVGTSGYDYYHVDDLDQIIAGHESLMEKGEGTSCYYRFLTKGQHWVWLQTRYYISYHQWNSKPEFVVCTHRVISYVDVMIQSRKGADLDDGTDDPATDSTYCSWSSTRTLLSPSRKTSHGDDSSKVRSRSSYLSKYSSDSGTSASHSKESSYSKRSPLKSSQRSSNRGFYQSSRHQQQQSNSCPAQSLAATQPTTTYIEPKASLTAVPLQSIVGFPVGTVTSAQLIRQPPVEITDHVKRKQQELIQLRQLMNEKEEELQQFVMAQARSGMIPSIINPPYAVPISGVSGTATQAGSVTILPSISSELYTPYISVGPPLSLASASTYEAGPAMQMSEGEVLPFSQQAQFLLSSQQNPPTTH